MPDSKITALTSISTSTDPANDPLVIVDVSDTSMAATGTTKKVTLNQLLGASGTATLASATITGDLTVDTSTLKVDSANNRVGVVNASPAAALDILGGKDSTNVIVGAPLSTVGGGAFANYSELLFKNTAGSNSDASIRAYGNVWNAAGSQLAFFTSNNSAVAERYRIDNTGVSTWSVGGSTAMTLNSTGLGVKGSPISPLTAYGATVAKAPVMLLTTVGSPDYGWDFSVDGAVNGNMFIRRLVAGTKTDVLEFDRATGNVGIGVTPSAWAAGYKAIQIAASQSTALMGSGNQTELTTNAFFDGAWKYQGAGTVAASRYSQQSGVHYWYSAAAGAAGTAIGSGFTNAAMTLDASGNLNLGVTSSLINTTRRLSVSGTVAAALQSTGAATVETINVWHTATSGNNIFVDFDTEAAVTSRGSISYNRAGGLVAYNTTSDYRAKDIIGPVSNSGSLIDSLKVYAGKMKGATIERPMLIAHEAQEVAPYAVTGTKDEVDADGKPKYQQMDASALVPLLIAEIQSLRARVQTLETR